MFVFPRWQSIVDFVVLTAALYAVLQWATQARAVRVVLAIVALLAGALVARAHSLAITSLVLEAAAVLVVGALFIVFQAEVRRALTRLDTTFLLAPHRARPLDREAAAIAEAAFSLARHRTGALIVLTREDPIGELTEGGVILRADLSRALLESIFQKDSPLHDGAVIIEGERLSRACALLPLSRRNDVPQDFGTRHRAAAGLAERCDACGTGASRIPTIDALSLTRTGRHPPTCSRPHALERRQATRLERVTCPPAKGTHNGIWVFTRSGVSICRRSA